MGGCVLFNHRKIQIISQGSFEPFPDLTMTAGYTVTITLAKRSSIYRGFYTLKTDRYLKIAKLFYDCCYRVAMLSSFWFGPYHTALCYIKQEFSQIDKCTVVDNKFLLISFETSLNERISLRKVVAFIKTFGDVSKLIIFRNTHILSNGRTCFSVKAQMDIWPNLVQFWNPR